ncbi:hypothetical protein REC12_24335 [Desulfosporosinus sp. PR]|uniref:hypothetical protein n=1 Tax=Candidatus Desulfosporosinus nitrosoreducens TaxID=3401928 RepID=UPI0027F1F4BC|nr:hypothetical protein [Desulfosporosinus sp. PR]MDQ7096725.1 hypothetical protein [Desulfosporosinus sp. PR]
MNKREIVSLACKILGVYVIIQGIDIIANVLTASVINPNQMGLENLIAIIVPYIFPIIFGVLLWVLSGRLSSTMVEAGDFTNDSSSSIKADDIQRIVFSAIGLLLIGNSLPKIVTNLTSMLTTSEVPNMTARLLPGMVGALIQIIFGIGVFLGSKGLVSLLNMFKYAGLKRDEES